MNGHDREVYPNPQLQLVVAELRYPLTPGLGAAGLLDRLVGMLGGVFPIAETLLEESLDPGASGLTELQRRIRARLQSADKYTAVAISTTQCVLETSDYRGWAAFRPLLANLYAALTEVGAPVGVERLGLRYIDEIERPEPLDVPGEWSTFLDPALVGSSMHLARRLNVSAPAMSHELLRYELKESQTIVVRHGARSGFAVNPDSPLRIRRQRSGGPFYLIDIDSYWEPEQLHLGFDEQQLMSLADELHEPIHHVFEGCITDRLRNEVLRVVG